MLVTPMLAARGASRLEAVATSDERALPAEPARERESQQAGDHYVPNDASGTLYFLVVLRHGGGCGALGVEARLGI